MVFFLVVLYVFALNISFSFNRVFSPVFYFVSLSFTVAILIVVETIYSFAVLNQTQSLRREKEKFQLSLLDLQMESLLLKTLSDIIETFGEEISLDDVLEKIADSLKKSSSMKQSPCNSWVRISRKPSWDNPLSYPKNC